MRILLITQYWAPENGVPQRRWGWLTQILEDVGHEVLVVAPPPHYLRDIGFREWVKHKGFRSKIEIRDDVRQTEMVRSGYFPGGSSITQKTINQVAVAIGGLRAVTRRKGPVNDFRPQLVIGTVPALPTAFVTAAAALRFKIPYVIDLRDAWPELLTEADRWNVATGSPSLRQRILTKGPLQLVVKVTDFCLTRLLGRASGVISTSSYLAKDLETRRHRPLRTWTIRNVFPSETLIEKRPKLTSGEGTLNVLYAGTLGRAQNLSNALKASKIANDKGVEVHLRFVGAGAAKTDLMAIAEAMKIPVTFEDRRDATLLEECYRWADTALVHLTDWAALANAVPSKTYELMNQQLHISGVVTGETARIIETLDAGDVVNPEDPEALAELWMDLAQDRSRLEVPVSGSRWVEQQRTDYSPRTLLECVEWVSGVEK